MVLPVASACPTAAASLPHRRNASARLAKSLALYGHGSGPYRNWSQHAAVYFMRSTDLGLTWRQHGSPSSIPWQSAMGETADGPGEPSPARVPDGTLLCVFRADASSCAGLTTAGALLASYYWMARSDDDGEHWGAA
eukprot:gene2936-730_t